MTSESKKEFDNIVILYIIRKFRILSFNWYEGTYFFENDLVLKCIAKIDDLGVCLKKSVKTIEAGDLDLAK